MGATHNFEKNGTATMFFLKKAFLVTLLLYNFTNMTSNLTLNEFS